MQSGLRAVLGPSCFWGLAFGRSFVGGGKADASTGHWATWPRSKSLPYIRSLEMTAELVLLAAFSSTMRIDKGFGAVQKRRPLRLYMILWQRRRSVSEALSNSRTSLRPARKRVHAHGRQDVQISTPPAVPHRSSDVLSSLRSNMFQPSMA